jgi:hypothetical protein
MRLAILLALVLTAAQAGAATVVIPDSVDFYTDGQAQLGRHHQVTVHQESTLNDYTSFFFDSEFDPLTSIPVLKNFSYNLDEGSDWYLVREGDSFTPQAIANGDVVTLVEPGSAANGKVIDPTYWSNWPIPGVDPFPLQAWQTSFYLGFATSLGFEDFPERDIYGWVELQFYPTLGSSVPSRLRMLGSATAFDSGGIVIGSLQAVPEPSSLVIGAMGLLACGCRRRME